jgi:hypothetical protein
MADIFTDFLEECPYDAKKYKGQWDHKLKDQDTLLLMDYIQTLLIDGYKNSYIKKQLVLEVGFTVPAADLIIAKAWQLLRKTDDADAVRTKNIRRLERIYELAISEDNLKAATSAVAELNKLMGLNKTTVKVESEEFQFLLGGERSE